MNGACVKERCMWMFSFYFRQARLNIKKGACVKKKGANSCFQFICLQNGHDRRCMCLKNSSKSDLHFILDFRKMG